MKKDKNQGVVFVLPKSKEFFGRIQDDFEKASAPIMQPATSEVRARTHVVPQGVRQAETKREIESLKALKENLHKLAELHQRLKTMLDELDDWVKEDK
ncbi:MAG: hypothetical protein HY390_06180 [Deltaproteobacteria bacterium]|nr:hypothetical protein [Deltaproteobacteria bacterium]